MPPNLSAAVIVAEKNRIVHGQLLAVHIKAFFGDERRDDGLALVIHGDAENRESLWAVFVLHVDQPGNFHTAGIAPGGPEIYEHHFAFVVSKVHVFAAYVFQFELRFGLAGGGGLCVMNAGAGKLGLRDRRKW